MVSLVPDQVDIAILAAHPPALGGLRAALGDHLYGVMRDLRVIAKPVGIGMAVAGAQAARRVLQLSPRVVIEIGAVGAYPGLGYQPSDVVVGTRVTLADPTVNDGRASFPEPMQTVIETHGMITDGLTTAGNGRKVSVASPLSATRDEDMAQREHERHRCEVESLEAFAVASACALSRVPYACVFGVSHELGRGARDQANQYERAAMDAAAKTVIAWINQGAGGMPHGRT